MNIARIIQRLRPKTARSDAGVSLAPPQEIRPQTDRFQRIVAPDPEQRMEGVAFSGDGQTLAVALSDTNRVYLYRRQHGSMAFEDEPCCRLEGAASGLDYPHDLAFSPAGDQALLAVAQRSGSILIFRNSGRPGQYGPEPAYRIRGRQTGLQYSDGVAFLPPRGDCLAACNLTTDKVTFYRRTPRADTTEFEARPCFTMQRKGIAMPDGLAFSRDGRWLAVANHGQQTVSIYRRQDGDGGNEPSFHRKPVAVIADSSLHYPHSVAFTPRRNHVVVTCAGANYLNIYRCEPGPADDPSEVRWSLGPAQQLLIGSEDTFRAVNACNKMEGGPKGVAVHDDLLAVCRPETHLSLYAIEESGDGLSLQ